MIQRSEQTNSNVGNGHFAAFTHHNIPGIALVQCGNRLHPLSVEGFARHGRRPLNHASSSLPNRLPQPNVTAPMIGGPAPLATRLRCFVGKEFDLLAIV